MCYIADCMCGGWIQDGRYPWTGSLVYGLGTDLSDTLHYCILFPLRVCDVFKACKELSYSGGASCISRGVCLPGLGNRIHRMRRAMCHITGHIVQVHEPAYVIHSFNSLKVFTQVGPAVILRPVFVGFS